MNGSLFGSQLEICQPFQDTLSSLQRRILPQFTGKGSLVLRYSSSPFVWKTPLTNVVKIRLHDLWWVLQYSKMWTFFLLLFSIFSSFMYRHKWSLPPSIYRGILQPGEVKLILWCHWSELHASTDVREPLSLHQAVWCNTTETLSTWWLCTCVCNLNLCLVTVQTVRFSFPATFCNATSLCFTKVNSNSVQYQKLFRSGRRIRQTWNYY